MAKSEALHDRGMVVLKLRSPATTVKDELASADDFPNSYGPPPQATRSARRRPSWPGGAP